MSPSRLPRALAALLLAAALPACGAGARYPTRPAPETLPAGSPLLSETLGQTDAWLRHYLMAGQPDSALLLLEDGRGTAPRDRLLRELQRGVVLHYAGRYDESNAAFEWAEAEAESRYTRSLSQAAGSLAINDAVVDYTPPPPEMAMIPYYRMLNYLALGSTDGTLVEARKANAYLERIRTGAREPCVGEAFVQWMTGLVYSGAGERNDALVSYRQAQRAYDACAALDGASAPSALGADLYHAARAVGIGEVADSAAARYQLPAVLAPGDEAQLVLLLEHGWVAHRASEDIHVPIFPEDVKGIGGGDDPSALETAALMGARLAANLLEQSRWGSVYDEHPVVQAADMADGAHVLKFAWPVARLEASAPAGVRVVVNGVEREPALAEDLSAAVVRRWEARRAASIGRMVTRGILKYVAARELERKAEKEGGEVAGWLAGRAANLAGNLLERADTRSWSLLPDRISVARLSLPPGEHEVRIEVLGEGGEVLETLDYGKVSLSPGGTLILNRRVWGGGEGDFARFTRLPKPDVPVPTPAVAAGAAPAADSAAPVSVPAEMREAARTEQKAGKADSEESRRERPRCAPRVTSTGQVPAVGRALPTPRGAGCQ